MKPQRRAAVLVLVAAGVAAALVVRARTAASWAVPTARTIPSSGMRPRVVELGSTGCSSCRAMHRELAQLRIECGDALEVTEIDVFRDREAWQRFDVRVIPTQVLVDASGSEIGRHTGFLSRADIRRRFAAHGVRCGA